MTEEQESPGKSQGKKQGRKRKWLLSFYPAAGAAVNGKCAACFYFKQVNTSKHVRSFCTLTGEKATPGGICEFWATAVPYD